eukprot:768001-Hanusia_phi.AAC.1
MQRTISGGYNGCINQDSKDCSVCSWWGGYYVKTTGIAGRPASAPDLVVVAAVQQHCDRWHSGRLLPELHLLCLLPFGVGYSCIDCTPRAFSLQAPELKPAADSVLRARVGDRTRLQCTQNHPPRPDTIPLSKGSIHSCRRCWRVIDRSGGRFSLQRQTCPFTNEGCPPNKGVDLICTDEAENYNCGDKCKYGRWRISWLLRKSIPPLPNAADLMLNGQDRCQDKLFSWRAANPSPTCCDCQPLILPLRLQLLLQAMRWVVDVVDEGRRRAGLRFDQPMLGGRKLTRYSVKISKALSKDPTLL